MQALSSSSEKQSTGSSNDLRPSADKLTPEIRFELEKILASESFRASERCQTFLRYVVEAACCNPPVELKERTLGVTIWNRPPDYDTGTDAIVRVKASEIRRRLAQYNLSADPKRAVTITLEPGSYVPRIERKVMPEPEVIPEPPPKEKLPRGRLLFILLALILFAVGVWGGLSFLQNRLASGSAAREFWAPIVASGDSIVCTAAPSAYRHIPSRPDRPSDTNVATRLRDQLQRLGGKPRIGKAQDVALDDLKSVPYVLIGGPGINQWTKEMAEELRFGMGMANQRGRIIDRQNPSRFWEPLYDHDGKLQEDYVLISRVLRSPSGRPMVAVAGLTAYGSLAGGHFLTNDAALDTINRIGPSDWAEKNFQMVLKTKMRNGVAQMPEVASAIFW
jgi:hypothetical protein